MVIDPQNSDRLILGTERLGVQISENGGETYRAANQGFSHRRIVDAAVDPRHPEHALVVLTSSFEPLLETNDAGRTWTPLATGLKSGPPRHIFASPDGWFAAPGPGGLLRYDSAKSSWVPVNQVNEASAASSDRTGVTLKKTTAQRSNTAAAKPAANSSRSAATKSTVLFHSRVNDMAFGHDAWYAATEDGLAVSRDRGMNWSTVSLGPAKQLPSPAAPGMSAAAIRAVSTSNGDAYVWALGSHQLEVSGDAGKTWIARSLPFEPRGSLHLHPTDATSVVLASDHGVFVSRDAGASWQQANLSELSIQDLAAVRNTVVVSAANGGLFVSRDGAKTWGRLESPNAEGTLSALRSREAGNQLVAASSTEGLFVMDLGSASSAAADSQAASPAAQR
jgi:photosystem II stability/assembly factor-like uncharacterized protein